ncbi:MAG TPA: hypothetical protein VII52_04120, partial [Gemmatimonadaceae bacterium]
MSAADRSTLLTLAGPREEALALARSGRGVEAEAAMRLARFLYSLAPLSNAGSAYAETMHQAAESYLSYQRGDHAGASARMVASLEATNRLAEHWGESAFIQCRRVDLEHNLMRVEMRRGAPGEAVWRGNELLRVVSTAPFDGRVTKALTELIMATVAELVAPLSVTEARAVIQSLAWVAAAGATPSPRSVEWLELKLAALGDDPLRFMETSVSFVRAGRGTTAVLWYAAVLDLARACAALDTPVARNARDELLTGLDAAPRVPQCMRRRTAEIATEALFAQAVSAFERGRTAAWSVGAVDAAQLSLEDQLARVALSDRCVLQKVAEPRERALALARRGQYDDAECLIKRAAILATVGQLSPPARLYAHSLQQAAQSYLSFRRGNHAEARARMLAAIDTTEQLADWWTDSELVTCRRVHLAHNLMRVEAASGASHRAIEIGTRLLASLGGDELETPPPSADAALCAPRA